jgi:hypothetical protein
MPAYQPKNTHIIAEYPTTGAAYCMRSVPGPEAIPIPPIGMSSGRRYNLENGLTKNPKKTPK